MSVGQRHSYKTGMEAEKSGKRKCDSGGSRSREQGAVCCVFLFVSFKKRLHSVLLHLLKAMFLTTYLDKFLI